MSKARLASVVLAVWVTAVSSFFLAAQLGREAPLFTTLLTAARIAPFASFAKLAAQLLGCIFAARAARRHEAGGVVRTAWTWMSAWLGCWFAGQLVLAAYERILHVVPPLPSLGDGLFIAGYVFVIAALFRFASAYRASGFAVGGARDHALVALAACAVFAALAYVILLPIALAPTPLGARLINVGYPLLDLGIFIPALVLLRITIRFRGGHVWRVWGALLVGIVFAAGGDLMFADVSQVNVAAIAPLADLFFILGYTFCAYGTWLQYELVSAEGAGGG